MTPRSGFVEVYKDDAGEWRWRRKAGNGRTIGDSGEGYTEKRTAVRAAQSANPDLPMRVRP